jgi:hypothetical protein
LCVPPTSHTPCPAVRPLQLSRRRRCSGRPAALPPALRIRLQQLLRQLGQAGRLGGGAQQGPQSRWRHAAASERSSSTAASQQGRAQRPVHFAPGAPGAPGAAMRAGTGRRSHFWCGVCHAGQHELLSAAAPPASLTTSHGLLSTIGRCGMTACRTTRTVRHPCAAASAVAAVAAAECCYRTGGRRWRRRGGSDSL